MNHGSGGRVKRVEHSPDGPRKLLAGGQGDGGLGVAATGGAC